MKAELIPGITKSEVAEPHGVFWSATSKGVYSVSRQSLYNIVSLLGFRLYNSELYQIIGCILYKRTDQEFMDIIKGYINPGRVDYMPICDAYEKFMQSSSTFTISRIQKLNKSALLNDTREVCYKIFRDGIIEITAKEILFITYDLVPDNKLILYSKIQQRDHPTTMGGMYPEYINRALNWTEHKGYIKRILGYLSHEYKDETTGYIIVLVEQVADPTDGGGSGKNIFCNLLSHTTSYCSINGGQATYDVNFFQTWSNQRLLGISDAPKNFPFEFLKEPSTGSFVHKKLYKDQNEVLCEDGPKFIIQTNYSYEVSDGGLRRRIIPLEFTDFFTKTGGVDVYFGCHFPFGWGEDDWAGFDSLIALSVQEWLKSGLKLSPVTLTETGWEKQFEQSYSKNLSQFIQDNFDTWVTTNEGVIPSNDIRNSIKTFYSENDVPQKFHYSTQKISAAIKEWAHHYGYDCLVNKQQKIGLDNKKCFVFTKR